MAQQPPEDWPAPAPPAGRPQGCPGGRGGEGRARTAAERAPEAAYGGWRPSPPAPSARRPPTPTDPGLRIQTPPQQPQPSNHLFNPHPPKLHSLRARSSARSAGARSPSCPHTRTLKTFILFLDWGEGYLGDRGAPASQAGRRGLAGASEPPPFSPPGPGACSLPGLRRGAQDASCTHPVSRFLFSPAASRRPRNF